MPRSMQRGRHSRPTRGGRGRQAAIAATVTVAAVGLLSGVAAAAGTVIHGAEPATFYGCSRAGSGNLRLVAATSPCRRHETRVQWAGSAPTPSPGPTGPSGPPGPAGPSGPPGPAPTNGTTVGEARIPIGTHGLRLNVLDGVGQCNIEVDDRLGSESATVWLSQGGATEAVDAAAGVAYERPQNLVGAGQASHLLIRMVSTSETATLDVWIRQANDGCTETWEIHAA